MPKKIFLLSLLLTYFNQFLVAQQSFNIFSYQLPQGFTIQQQDEKLLLANVGIGVIIILTPESAGNSKPAADFNADWYSYVASGNTVLGFPNKKSSDFGNGWTITIGQSKVISNGKTYWAQLRTFTKKNQKASALFFANDASNQNIFDEFIKQVKLSDSLPVDKLVQNKKSADTIISKTTIQQTDNINSNSSITNSWGNMQFSLPKNWISKKENNVLKLTPATLRSGEIFFIALMEPMGGEPDLSNALLQTWKQISNAMGENLISTWEGKKINIQKTIQGFDYVNDEKQTKRMNGLDIIISLFLVKTETGVERIALYQYELRAQGMDYNPAKSDSYFYIIQNLIYSIQFKQKPSVNIPVADYKGSDIAGVWCGISGSFNAFSGSYDQAAGYFILLKNGTAYNYRSMPKGGLADLNIYMHQQLYPDYWGNYTYSGGKGVFTNKYYSRIDFMLNGQKMKVTKYQMDHSFIKLPDFNQAKLNGTYSFKTGESVSFTTNGKFIDNGALEIISHDVYYEPYHITRGGGSGSYEIRDYSIIFYYTDGRKFQTAFADFTFDPANLSPNKLLLGENLDELTRK